MKSSERKGPYCSRCCRSELKPKEELQHIHTIIVSKLEQKCPRVYITEEKSNPSWPLEDEEEEVKHDKWCQKVKVGTENNTELSHTRKGGKIRDSKQMILCTCLYCHLPLLLKLCPFIKRHHYVKCCGSFFSINIFFVFVNIKKFIIHFYKKN